MDWQMMLIWDAHSVFVAYSEQASFSIIGESFLI